MKKVYISFITILIFFLTGCSNNVDSVKDSTLDFDKSITVGQAFDNYKYFSDTKWEEFKTNNGRQIVEFTGTFNDKYLDYLNNQFKKAIKKHPEKAINKAELVVQFIINKDGTFNVFASAFKTFYNDKKKRKYTYTISSINGLLSRIYNNKILGMYAYASGKIIILF